MTDRIYLLIIISNNTCFARILVKEGYLKSLRRIIFSRYNQLTRQKKHTFNKLSEPTAFIFSLGFVTEKINVTKVLWIALVNRQV